LSTTQNGYLSQKPQRGSIKHREIHIPAQEGPGAFLASTQHGRCISKKCAPIIGGGLTGTYSVSSAPGWTITTGGTGDNIAANASGGITITAASDDNFDTTLDSITTFTAVSGKKISMLARIAVSAVTGIGFKIGLSTGAGAAALPFGTNYTDCIVVSKEITDASVIGQCQGNDGDVRASSEFGDMVNATEVEIGFVAYIHATTPSGSWFYNGEEIPFTAAQLTEVAALLTTPLTTYATIHVTGVTATNPTLSVNSFQMEMDN
jgi:hypothetical protein